MKLYFFDIEHTGLKTEDEVGTILTDAAAASRELLSALIETAAGAFRDVENGVISGSVREQGGGVLFECSLHLRSTWRS